MSEVSLVYANRLLTTDEAANYLAVTPQTLESWRYNGAVLIPYVKIGRCVRYRLNDLETYITDSLVLKGEG